MTEIKALIAERRRLRLIPQGYTEVDELVAIRELLSLQRPEEAKQRLDILLNRYHPAWSAGSERFT